MSCSFDPLVLTQRLIQIPSVTPDTGDVLDVLENHLVFLGFHCERRVFVSGDSYAVPNLYGRWGRGRPHLCFVGHTDVVPPGDQELWSFPPFQGVVDREILYGRGAADMKGAIASFLCATQQFLSSVTSCAQGAFQGSLSFLITGDEEGVAQNGIQKMLPWLWERGERWDACIVGEPASAQTLGDQIKVGRRGSLSGLLKIHGKQGHVAYPHLADNPIPPLLCLLKDFYAQVWDQGNDSFPPSHFEVTALDTDNSAMNVIPDSCEARFNIRYNPLQTEEKLIDFFHEHCKKLGKPYELQWLSKGRPFYTPPGPLRSLAHRAITKVTGYPPQDSCTGGTSDGRFIHPYCPVMELGLVGASIHQVDEHVPVQDLYTLQDIYGNFLESFFHNENAL